MATPVKPWEAKASTGLEQGKLQQSTANANSLPPIVPQRPTTNYSMYSPYSGTTGGPTGYYSPSYQGFGGSYGYRPYNMYGGLGGYGYGQPGGQMGESPFVRQAEESTRVAFQSVESVVGAFASVSMMLESTYIAVHSSFRAVLGVAQHFTRLKDHIWSIITAVALLRRLRWWLKHMLRVLRLRQLSTSEDAWDEVSSQYQQLPLPAGAQVGNYNNRVWPLVVFVAIVLGVPWLLWKLLLKRREAQESEESSWSSSSNQAVVVRAKYDFCAERSNELSFSAGDEMVLAPRQLQNGWLLAGRNRTSGLIPENYVEIVGPTGSGQAHQHNTARNISQRGLLSDEENLLND